jgi:hypothetical protein
MLALDAAQVARDLGLEREVLRFAAEMAEQHVFGGDGGVGFELETPVAVWTAFPEERRAAESIRRSLVQPNRRGTPIGSASLSAKVFPNFVVPMRGARTAPRFAHSPRPPPPRQSRADRSLDSGRQPGPRPIAGEIKVAVLRPGFRPFASC